MHKFGDTQMQQVVRYIKSLCIHLQCLFFIQSFNKAATKARVMVSRKLLTETEHAELLGLFQQATVGDGNVWKMFSKLMKKKTFHFHFF